MRRYPQFTISPAILVALVACWWLATDVLGAPAYVVPAPEQVLRALIDGLSRAPWDTGGLLVPHRQSRSGKRCSASRSARRSARVLGFVICRIGRSSGKSWYPYIVGFQSLPKVALAPLMVVWFGFGLRRQGVHHRDDHLLPGAGEHHGGLSGGRARADRAGALLQRQRMAPAHRRSFCRAACRSCSPGLASRRCWRSSARWSASSSAPAPASACC